ncbi:hypothetical protein KL939_004572 [Ogataea angusta]|nr:hypothetical protein KL939_004572 [Ogataea angusta]
MSEAKTCCGGACVSKSGYDLLTWKDPSVSGKVFGSLVGSLLLLKSVNLLSIVFYISAFVLAVSALGEYAGKLATGQGFVTRFRPEYKNVIGQYAEEYASHAANLIKNAELKLQEIVYSKDIDSTLKVAGVAYILYKLTSWFTLWTLLFTATLTAFSVPPVYLKNQRQIDDAIVTYTKVAKDKLAELLQLIKEKTGPALENAEKKLGPVGSFIRSKVPVRTAGSTVGDIPASNSTASTAQSAPSVPSAAPSASTETGDDAITNPLADVKKQAEAAL